VHVKSLHIIIIIIIITCQKLTTGKISRTVPPDINPKTFSRLFVPWKSPQIPAEHHCPWAACL